MVTRMKQQGNIIVHGTLKLCVIFLDVIILSVLFNCFFIC